MNGRYGTAAREARRQRSRHNRHAKEFGFRLTWGKDAYPPSRVERGAAKTRGLIAPHMQVQPDQQAGMDPESAVRAYLAQIGRKGGAAGAGAAKRRGDPEHYRCLAARSRRPSIKPRCQMTVHHDGTISFWSVLRQAWERRPAADIGAAELATMPQGDRDAIAGAKK